MNSIRVEKEPGGRVTVALAGHFGIEESTYLREELMGYLEAGWHTVRFDLTEVESIDSAGLGLLMALAKRAVQRGGNLVVTGLRGRVRERFEEAGLGQGISVE